MRFGVVCLVAISACGRLDFSTREQPDAAPIGSSITLTYPPRAIALVNQTAFDLAPMVTGTGVRFSVSPALPTGVTLDSTTGTITGVPADIVDGQRYVITAANAAAQATAEVRLTALPGLLVDRTMDLADDNGGADASCFSATAGGCTLRAALQTINTQPQLALVLVSPGDYALGASLPPTLNDVMVAGQGTVTLRSATVHGGFGLLVQSAGHRVRLAHLTVRDFGGIDGPGGQIFNAASALEVTDSRFINQASLGKGGVFYVYNGASLTIDDSYFAQNTSNPGNGWGGVIDGEGTNTTVIVRGTTAEQNVAPWGSFSHITTGTTLTLENSTLHHNLSTIAGTLATPGGVYFLRNDTIVYNTNSNSTPDSAAIYLYSAPCHYTVENTLVAFNTDVTTAQHNCHIRDVTTSITSSGGNLFSDMASDCTQYFTGDRLSVDPALDATSPSNHGGLTDTFLLTAGSPAIDNGTANCPATDQRGLPRPAGAGCDIGAVEMQ